jgi:hypothetical protein
VGRVGASAVMGRPICWSVANLAEDNVRGL